MVAVPLADAVRAQLDLPRNLQGVVIGSVVEGSPSSFAGLRQGDVVTEIGNKQIRGMMDFYRSLSSGDKREILFRVQREGKEQTLSLVR